MNAPHSIRDLYDTLGLRSEGEVDFTVQSVPALHPELPFRSPKLRADYFSFILTKHGRGTYRLDDRTFPFGDGSLYFTNPGHVKSYELYESEEAFIIMATESYLSSHVAHDVYEQFPFLLADITPPHLPAPTDFEEYAQLFDQIGQEFSRPSKYGNKIIGNYMLVLLLKIKEKFWADYNPIAEEATHGSRIIKSFKKALEEEFAKVLSGGRESIQLQAQYFAERLHLHPNYLNAVVKSRTGRTLSRWITDRTVEVAKSLLLKSDYSAKEIGLLLGYSEPTHFSRFFKRHTGQAPIAYRKAQQRS